LRAQSRTKVGETGNVAATGKKQTIPEMAASGNMSRPRRIPQMMMPRSSCNRLNVPEFLASQVLDERLFIALLEVSRADYGLARRHASSNSWPDISEGENCWSIAISSIDGTRIRESLVDKEFDIESAYPVFPSANTSTFLRSQPLASISLYSKTGSDGESWFHITFK
jgi:hypothetical protein